MKSLVIDPLRRKILRGAALLSVPLSVSTLLACTKKSDMTPALWQQWRTDWDRMQAIATRRGWEVTPVEMANPASGAQLAAIVNRYGLNFPPQLHDVLTVYSASVQFGWSVPSHMRPMHHASFSYPTTSGIRDHVFDLGQIGEHAIANFLGWKKQLAHRDVSEEPNTPEMWENQFPFGYLKNGDILTIDTSKQDGTNQPVRYFSHELSGLHGRAIAPDFLTFISVYSKLGCAGTEDASLLAFIETSDDGFTTHLSATGQGAKRWFAFLERPVNDRGPDEPPPSIVAKSVADHALLAAARDNNFDGMMVALALGAEINCVPSQKWMLETTNWSDEFSTAVSYATIHDNIPALEKLLSRGADLNTRRLAANDAAKSGKLETLRWLISKGARVNGWRDQRYWPLHDLVNRSRLDKNADEEFVKTMLGFGVSRTEALRNAPRPIETERYYAMLRALLEAGATPDAPWDNGITMLMWGGVGTAKILLEHGADVKRRTNQGWTALHYTDDPAKVRVLVAAGADVNARIVHTGDSNQRHYRPLQGALMSRYHKPSTQLIDTLLELGADPRLLDGDGRSTLAYCTTVADFERFKAYQMDPKARLPKEGTLLHNLVNLQGGFTHSEIRALFLHLLKLGLEINAVDRDGRTILHLLAEHGRGSPEDVQLATASGADRAIKDKSGKTAHELAPKSEKALRAALVVPK